MHQVTSLIPGKLAWSFRIPIPKLVSPVRWPNLPNYFRIRRISSGWYCSILNSINVVLPEVAFLREAKILRCDHIMLTKDSDQSATTHSDRSVKCHQITKNNRHQNLKEITYPPTHKLLIQSNLKITYTEMTCIF